MTDAGRIIKDIETWGKFIAGRGDLIKHLSGKRVTQRQAIQAHCYECQGYCADGREDCEKPECPLYPFSQFNPNRSKRSTTWRKKIPQDVTQPMN